MNGPRAGPQNLSAAFSAQIAEVLEVIDGRRSEGEGNLPRGIFWWMISRRVKSRVKKVLDIPVEEILGSAWTRLKALQAHLDAPPEEIFREMVGGHTIESLHEPRTEIEIDGWHIGSLEFEIVLRLEIKAVELKIQGGKVRRAAAGNCTAGGDFKCKITLYGMAHTVARSTPLAHFDIPGAIEFDPALPIPRIPEALRQSAE